MQGYNMKIDINIPENVDKKWYLLQQTYNIWSSSEFNKDSISIIEKNNEIIHDIYKGISKQEFVMYTYFLDIDKIKYRSNNFDGILDFDTNALELTYYDKRHIDVCNEIKEIIETAKEEEMPNFDLRTYIYIPENKDSNFYYNLISFIYYLSEVNIKEHGINICDRKGNFIKYKNLNFPKINLNKFYYYDNNIFIGTHTQNNMLIIYNLPKNKFLEIRRWINQQI